MIEGLKGLRLVHIVGADFGERSCSKDKELQNGNPQLAYHRTRPAICTLLPPCCLFIFNFVIITMKSIQSRMQVQHQSQLLK
jgi:hypothetical protein